MSITRVYSLTPDWKNSEYQGEALHYFLRFGEEAPELLALMGATLVAELDGPVNLTVTGGENIHLGHGLYRQGRIKSHIDLQSSEWAPIKKVEEALRIEQEDVIVSSEDGFFSFTTTEIRNGYVKTWGHPINSKGFSVVRLPIDHSTLSVYRHEKSLA